MTPRLLKYQNTKERKKRSYSSLLTVSLYTSSKSIMFKIILKTNGDDKIHPKTMNSAPSLLSKYGDDTLASAGAKLFLNGINTLRNTSNRESNKSLISLQKVAFLLIT